MADSTENNINVGLQSNKVISCVFAIIVLSALLIPLLGMIWAPTETTVENRELAERPRLMTDAGLNKNFLSDAGSYFEDHYAYREFLVSVEARLFYDVFDVSTNDNVIAGTNDWLFFSDTLSDYQNKNPIRERQARNIAHNLKLFQDWCEKQGANFVFTVPPNKNSIYGQYMPFYYPHVDNQSMELLETWLSLYNVNYADLFETLKDPQDHQYYFRGDSHWNNEGALLGHDAIAKSLNMEIPHFEDSDFVEVDQNGWDLNNMLFPLFPIKERGIALPGVNYGNVYWNYLEGDSEHSPTIVTEPNDSDPFSTISSENGTMLMFRDSFGMALVPYFACETEKARFEYAIPYNGMQLVGADFDNVVAERVQRNVQNLSNEVFIMLSPETTKESPAEKPEEESFSVTCTASRSGTMILISGNVEGIDLQTDSNIYVRLTDPNGQSRQYEAFCLDGELSNDDGFAIYVDGEQWAGNHVNAEIIVECDDRAYLSKKLQLQIP